MITASALLLSLAASASAFPAVKRQYVREYLFEGIEPAKDLVWHPCNETQEYPYQCARLSVPLDYQDPDNGLRAIVPIIKYPTNATGADYKGAVLFNPGGPGYLTTEPLWRQEFAQSLVDFITGPGYDIIGFDIRGIGYSIPYSACNISETDIIEPLRQNATLLRVPGKDGNYGNEKRATRRSHDGDTGLGDHYESRYGFYIPKIPTDTIYTDSYAFANLINSSCAPAIGAYNQAGPHMNTAVVATDMLMIGRALAREKKVDEDSFLVNYYGISYGTVLGQIFATMYPRNVGRFLLDGVVNMKEWQARTDINIFRHTDEGFSKFFELCSEAGPEVCDFYTGSSAQDIKDRFNNMTLRFNTEPWEGVEEVRTSLVLGLRLLKGKILDSLYDSLNQFPGLATLFAALDEVTSGPFETWNVTEITGVLSLPLVPPSNSTRAPAPLVRFPHSFYQTACGDAAPIIGQNVTEGEIEAYRKVSVVSGHARVGDRMVCTVYDIRPKWEWHENIGAGQTATPILFVGNILDPVTPWEDAEEAAEKFGGAGVFFVEVIAHAIAGAENECAFEKSRTYFQTGALPQYGSTCAEERRPFFEN